MAALNPPSKPIAESDKTLINLLRGRGRDDVAKFLFPGIDIESVEKTQATKLIDIIKMSAFDISGEPRDNELGPSGGKPQKTEQTPVNATKRDISTVSLVECRYCHQMNDGISCSKCGAPLPPRTL